jgi:quinol monooxygenase YgiN
MIVITGRMKIPDANRAAFLEITGHQVRLSIEEAGCLSYALYEGALAPGFLFFYEEWLDRAAIDFHFRQQYCLDFVRKLRALTEGVADMKIRTIAGKKA